MNSNKSEGMLECCGGHHAKKSLMFGITVLIVGLMMQNKYTTPEILEVIGVILVVKSLIMMVAKKE